MTFFLVLIVTFTVAILMITLTTPLEPAPERPAVRHWDDRD